MYQTIRTGPPEQPSGTAVQTRAALWDRSTNSRSPLGPSLLLYCSARPYAEQPSGTARRAVAARRDCRRCSPPPRLSFEQPSGTALHACSLCLFRTVEQSESTARRGKKTDARRNHSTVPTSFPWGFSIFLFFFFGIC